MVPLHASAIKTVDGCIAFVGPSGAGKSTLVAALSRRGHEVFSDDECFLQMDANGDVQAWPGLSGIRLWEDSRTALRFDYPDVKPAIEQSKKFFVPTPPSGKSVKAHHLSRVYCLQEAPSGAAEVSRLRGADAVEVLMQNVYPSELADRLGYKPRILMGCAAAIRKAPVYRLSRPLKFDALDQVVDLLESDLRS
jgi:hypothetical protein